MADGFTFSKCPANNCRARQRLLVVLLWLCPLVMLCPAAPRPRLWVAPPVLENPIILQLEPGINRIDLQKDAPGRDYLVNFPPATKGRVTSLTIDGRSKARHLVMIGGTIETPEPREPLTMKFDLGQVTGGTWQIKAYEKDKQAAFSQPLPFNATAQEIKQALDTLVGGPGHIAAVTGEAGGPWTVELTRNDPSVGRLTANLTGLAGQPKWTRTTQYPGQLGLICKNFRGTVFIEGIHITGPGLAEGIDIMSPYDQSQHVIQSCRIEPSFCRFHYDHQHPDALQAFNGPTRLILDRVDLLVRGDGQCLMAQPRETTKPVPLEALYDWYFRNVFFGGYLAPVTRLGPAWPILREDDFPANTKNQMENWIWHGDRQQPCYTYREGTRDFKKGIASGPGWMYLGHPNSAPDWLLQDQLPPEGGFANPAKQECGDHYQSPGYEGTAPDWGTNRQTEAANAKKP